MAVFVKKIDFLYRYYRKVAPAYRTDLFSVLSKSAEEVEALNFAKFQKLFAHAYENSPYYREKYDKAGIRSEDIRAQNDIEKIPLLVIR